MWLAVMLVAVQIAIVILRYVFSIGFISMQELVWYLSSALFLLGAAYALQIDGHVRVDVFYRSAGPGARALIDLCGCTLLLLPFVIASFVLAAPFVVQSWEILEGSKESSGLRAVFLLKTCVLAWAVLLGLQGVALFLRAFQYLRGGANNYSADSRIGRAGD